jgi:hypothetical protein
VCRRGGYGPVPASRNAHTLFDLFGLQGEARAEFYVLCEEIVGCLVLVEVLIDFGEGEDIEEGVFEEGPFVCLPFLGGFLTRLCSKAMSATFKTLSSL